MLLMLFPNLVSYWKDITKWTESMNTNVSPLLTTRNWSLQIDLSGLAETELPADNYKLVKVNKKLLKVL